MLSLFSNWSGNNKIVNIRARRLRGYMGKIGSLNIWARVENAGDSHGFGRVGRRAGRKCSRHEFNPRKLHIFRRGMQKGGSVVHSCRLAAGRGGGGAEGDAITKSKGRGDELARW